MGKSAIEWTEETWNRRIVNGRVNGDEEWGVDVSEKRFKIMTSHLDNELREKCPSSIPFALIKPHRKQAKKNHGQTLERLNERGGLDPIELVAVLEDRRILPWTREISAAQAILRIWKAMVV